MWQVIFTDYFDDWYSQLDESEQDSILYGLRLLQQAGHSLGRPHVDTLKDSKISNLKELRIQHNGNPYRIFFAFDPLRQAVMLCGGDKTGQKRFYQTMIPLAEQSYQSYLANLTEEKLNDKPTQ